MAFPWSVEQTIVKSNNSPESSLRCQEKHGRASNLSLNKQFFPTMIFNIFIAASIKLGVSLVFFRIILVGIFGVCPSIALISCMIFMTV